MGSNSFGTLFKITTWGESHGKAIGVVIDGCPAGLEIATEEIQSELDLRKPGKNPLTSPRQESDRVEILSGVFEGKTTGAPISLIIWNQDHNPAEYEKIKDVLRPGHANYTYLQKYGIFDYRGGGRASARETACRVAAGAVAKKLLKFFNITTCAFLKQVGNIRMDDLQHADIQELTKNTLESPLFCPDLEKTSEMSRHLEEVKNKGDSVGGIVEFWATLPTGLGDPVYEKLEAKLASAMLSIPATKGFEMGAGFSSAVMQGSAHNDAFFSKEGKILSKTNHAGGTLGGISNGMPLCVRVAFKPTSSIKIDQQTTDLEGNEKVLALPKEGRHDPCVAIRGVPVVGAMGAIVLADAALMNRLSRLV